MLWDDTCLCFYWSFDKKENGDDAQQKPEACGFQVLRSVGEGDGIVSGGDDPAVGPVVDEDMS